MRSWKRAPLALHIILWKYSLDHFSSTLAYSYEFHRKHNQKHNEYDILKILLAIVKTENLLFVSAISAKFVFNYIIILNYKFYLFLIDRANKFTHIFFSFFSRNSISRHTPSKSKDVGLGPMGCPRLYRMACVYWIYPGLASDVHRILCEKIR